MLRKIKSNSLVSGSAIYLLSNILTAVIPFALLPVLTRYLSPAEYGEVAMFQMLLAALAVITGLNVAGAASRKYYDANLAGHEIKNFVAICLQILLISSCFVLIVMALFHQQLSAWLGLKTQWILFAVLVSAFSVVIQLRLGQWQVRKQARKYGVLQVSQSLFNVLLTIVLVVVLMQGAAGRIVAQVWAVAVFAVLALLFLWRDDLLSFFVWKPAYIKEALGFGMPLIPHVGGVFLLNSLDRFVINSKLGLAEVGAYMVAVQLSGAMAIVFDAINKAYVPWLFERLQRDRLEEKQQIVRYTYAWFGVVLAGSGLLFFLGPWLVSLIVGKEYAKAGEVIGWLALGQAFGGMYLMVTNYIFYSKRTGLLSVATIASGLVNAVLLFLLINVYGLTGAAMAFCISMAIRFLLTWWVAQNRHPMPWLNLKNATIKIGN